METPDKAALLASLANDFGGVDKAEIFGSSRNFEPGSGRVTLGMCKVNDGNKKVFIQETTIVSFRGGAKLDGSRVPDDHFLAGDTPSLVVVFSWASADSHFKAWALAVMRALAVKRGADPATITPAMITGATCAQIIAGQLQEGLEVDFDVVAQKTRAGGEFTKPTFYGGRATAAPAAPAPEADPLAAMVAQAAPAPAPAPAPAVDLLAAMMTQATGALAAAAVAPTPAPTRDQKIAKLRQVPRYASLDFSATPEASLDAALAALGGS